MQIAWKQLFYSIDPVTNNTLQSINVFIYCDRGTRVRDSYEYLLAIFLLTEFYFINKSCTRIEYCVYLYVRDA